MQAIDKGIPMPTNSDPLRSRYPWRDMEIGDSFLFHKRVDAGNARQMCLAHSRDGVRFDWRKTHAGIRCWRVK